MDLTVETQHVFHSPYDFFLLAIIFIVFDIEIVLLIPVPLLIISKINISTILAIILFIIILVAGLLHEWNEGSLDWSS